MPGTVLSALYIMISFNLHNNLMEDCKYPTVEMRNRVLRLLKAAKPANDKNRVEDWSFSC